MWVYGRTFLGFKRQREREEPLHLNDGTKRF